MGTGFAPSDGGAWWWGRAYAEVDLIDAVLSAERAAVAYPETSTAGMTAGRSFDEMDAARAELRRAKRRLEQTQRGLAKRRVRA